MMKLENLSEKNLDERQADDILLLHKQTTTFQLNFGIARFRPPFVCLVNLPPKIKQNLGKIKRKNIYCLFDLPKVCLSQMMLFTPLITWAGRYV